MHAPSSICLFAILISFSSFAISLESNPIPLVRSDAVKPITPQERAARQQWAMELRDRVVGTFGNSKALLQAMPDFDFASDYLRVVLKLTIEPSGQIKDVIVTTTSGRHEFDSYAIKTVQQLAPFSKFPVNISSPTMMISIPLAAGNALNEDTSKRTADDIEIHALSCSIVLDKFSIAYAQASGTVINLTDHEIRHIQMEVAIERGMHRAPNPRVLTTIIEPVSPHSSQTFHVIGTAPFDWQDHERCSVMFRLYSGRDLHATGETEVRLSLPTVSSR